MRPRFSAQTITSTSVYSNRRSRLEKINSVLHMLNLCCSLDTQMEISGRQDISQWFKFIFKYKLKARKLGDIT